MNQNSPVPSVWRSSRDLNPGAGRPAYEISSFYGFTVVERTSWKMPDEAGR